MRIALFQYDIVWEDKQTNLTLIEKQLQQNSNFDLLVLPEMFTTGFTMNASKVAETIDGEAVLWLKTKAKEFDLAITCSLVISENGLFYNRMLFVQPNGTIDFYNKRHLFTLAGEYVVYEKGSEKKVVFYKGVRFCLQICYDLRFPVFSRYNNDYDVLLYVANWPVQRINAWDALLKARAIENMCYAIGVNRVGTDAINYTYNGHSQAIDFLGNTVIEPFKTSSLQVFEIKIDELNLVRTKLNFLNDKDSFHLL